MRPPREICRLSVFVYLLIIFMVVSCRADATEIAWYSRANTGSPHPVFLNHLARRDHADKDERNIQLGDVQDMLEAQLFSLESDRARSSARRRHCRFLVVSKAGALPAYRIFTMSCRGPIRICATACGRRNVDAGRVAASTFLEIRDGLGPRIAVQMEDKSRCRVGDKPYRRLPTPRRCPGYRPDRSLPCRPHVVESPSLRREIGKACCSPCLVKRPRS